MIGQPFALAAPAKTSEALRRGSGGFGGLWGTGFARPQTGGPHPVDHTGASPGPTPRPSAAAGPVPAVGAEPAGGAAAPGGGGGAGGIAAGLTGSGSRPRRRPASFVPSPPRRAQPKPAARSGPAWGFPPGAAEVAIFTHSPPATSPRTLPAGLPAAREGFCAAPASCLIRPGGSGLLRGSRLRPPPPPARRGGDGARGARQRGTAVPGRGGQTKERAPPWAAAGRT
ncbi:uncharacterized protein FN964_016053 isoform 1-T41 [Alca torda]